jgi:hypothetical protein
MWTLYPEARFVAMLTIARWLPRSPGWQRARSTTPSSAGSSATETRDRP